MTAIVPFCASGISGVQTTPSIVPAEPAPPAAYDHGTVRPRRRHVLVLCIAVAVARFVVSSQLAIFRLTPDEFATAGMARFLAGGEWNMQFGVATWQPGMATLLAPFYAVIGDPDWQFRVALMLNAAIGAASVVWLIKIIVRVTDVGPRLALLVAGAVAVLPSALSASAHVWAEPLVTLTFLFATWNMLRYFDRPSVGTALKVVAASVAAYLSHGRMLALLAIVVAILTGHALLTRHAMRAAIVVACGAVGGLVVRAYASWIIGELWTEPDRTNTTGGVLERLQHPVQVLDALFGQLWYQLCASALLVGIGLVILARRASGRSHPDSVDARVVLSLVVPLMLVSAVFMSDRARGDYVIYGRYNDAIMWPVLAVGAAWLINGWQRDSRRSALWTVGGVVAVAVESGLLLRQVHHVQLTGDGVVVFDMVAGVLPYVWRNGSVPILLTTASALGVFAVLATLSKLGGTRPGLAVTLVVAIVGFAGVRTWERFGDDAEVWAESSAIEELSPAVLDPDVPIGLLVMPDGFRPDEPTWRQVAYGFVYQWYLPEHSFDLDHGTADDVGPYVVAVANDRLLNDAGATIVWTDPVARIAIWREPNAPLQDGPVSADELSGSPD